MPEREYNFALPRHFSNWEVMYAFGKLRDTGIWDDLPRYMRMEISEAYKRRVGYTITEEDLNNINEDVWQRVQQLFFS